MDYTVFDVETANSQRASICSIGIIRYENNQVVFEKEFLINPEVEFNYFNIKIHGITEADVIEAPTFPEVWKEIRKYFNNTILVAHNAKSMDLCALYRTLERYNMPMVSNKYFCTMELAKSVFCNDSSVQSFRLDVLAKKCGISLLNHHNALDDTRACFELFRKLVELSKETIQPKTYYYVDNLGDTCCRSNNDKLYSSNTKEMQKLQLAVINIIADNDISNDEIVLLQSWLENHKQLKGFYPFDKIIEVVEAVMLDGVMDAEEKQILLGLLDAFVNPQTTNANVDFNQKTVCLSGEFNYGTKKQVEELLVKKGAVVVKSVTGKLDILILGEAGSVAWKYGNYGSKYEKACQFNDKGKSIIIVKESDVIS